MSGLITNTCKRSRTRRQRSLIFRASTSQLTLYNLQFQVHALAADFPVIAHFPSPLSLPRPCDGSTARSTAAEAEVSV